MDLFNDSDTIPEIFALFGFFVDDLNKFIYVIYYTQLQFISFTSKNKFKMGAVPGFLMQTI